MSIRIGRLTLDDPEQFTEAMGDQYANVAGAPIPGARVGLQHQLQLTSFTGQNGDTTAMRTNAHNQLRSLLNNTPYCLTAPLFTWTDDPANSYMFCVPSTAQSDPYGTSGLQFGLWQIKSFNLNQVGHARTHRRANEIYLRDRRLSTTPRDFRRTQYSTDFATMPVAWTPIVPAWVPPGSTDIITNNSSSGYAYNSVLPSIPSGNIGYVTGIADLAVISYELSTSGLNQGDVVIHDRAGTLTLPSTGADPNWVEIYGPDYPYTAGDVPVLDNGICRVSWDTSNGTNDGLLIESAGWSTSFIKMTKVLIQGYVGSTLNTFNTLASAKVEEWTPERAVVSCVLTSATTNTLPRITVYVTLQRGWSGPRIELYTPTVPNLTGYPAMTFVPYNSATQTSLVKVDGSDVGNIASTAASVAWPTATFGASTFTGENWLSFVQAGVPAATNVAVIQAAMTASTLTDSTAWGSSRNAFSLTSSTSLNYTSAHVGYQFRPSAYYAQEAESMTAASGTTSPVTDAAASNGNTTTTTRTSAAAHVTSATWPASGDYGSYRVFARVKTSASTASIYVTNGHGQGQLNGTNRTATTTSTSYVWLDLGVITQGNGSTLSIYAWATPAATVSVDRIETFPLMDVDSAYATAGAVQSNYSGARDLASYALLDVRQTPNVVAR